MELPKYATFAVLAAVALSPNPTSAQELSASASNEPPLTTLEHLQNIISTHPSVGKAQHDYCEAGFAVMQERTAYFPKLNLALSGGDKLVDKTTRGDEFGGVSAPEYDGNGVNLTLSLNQQIYDWE